MVPLTFSIPAEEGEYIIRSLGSDVRRYETLAGLLEEQSDAQLGELCRATDQVHRVAGVDDPDSRDPLRHSVSEELDTLPPVVPGLDAIRDAWSEVSAHVRELSRTTDVMLSGATVHGADGNHIALAHVSEPIAKRLTSPRCASVIADALRAVFSVGFEVSCQHLPPSENASSSL
jgi:hypothetical protein